MVSKELFNKDLFLLIFHSLFSLNDIFLNKKYNCYKIIQKQFKNFFKKSSKSIYYLIEIRWISYLNAFHFTKEYYIQLFDFFKNLLINENNFLLNEKDKKIINLLSNNLLYLEFNVLSEIIFPLKKFIIISQYNKISEIIPYLNEIESFFLTLKEFKEKNLIISLIEKSKISLKIIIDNFLINDFIKNIRFGVLKGEKKFSKHCQITFLSLKGIIMFYSNPIQNFLNDVSCFSNNGFFNLKKEWNEVKLIKDLFLCDSFWEENQEKFPSLFELFSRLLTIRFGISNVERIIKVIRNTQTYNRLNLKNSNLQKILFILANKKIIDIYRK